MTSATTDYRLTTGTLRLTVAEEAEDLFAIAERINPKRGFLFVSRVLGRHIPVAPSVHRARLRQLAAGCLPHLGSGPVMVMGFAETAVGLGAGVAQEIARTHPRCAYLPTTRHPVAGREWTAFSEDHSHASAHEVMRPQADPVWGDPGDPGRTLVLVDDEMTTGNTMANLARALRAAGLAFGRVVLVTLTDWSRGAAAQLVAQETGVDDVRSVSLLSGAWAWERDVSADLPPVPALDGARRPAWHPAGDLGLFGAPRLGISRFAGAGTIRAALSPVAHGARVLVIGSGEHVWTPFLLAEELESEGAQAKFCATTRSPIRMGAVIQEKIMFPDHYGVGVPMYLHNVARQEWDRIIMMTETGVEGVDDALVSALAPFDLIDGSGHVHRIGAMR